MSYHYDDTYDVYDERRVKARKPHTCQACGDTIQPGHRYARVGIVFRGSAETIKRCLRCQTLHAHLRERCRGDNRSWPDEHLAGGETYEDEWGQPPPPEVAALAFKTGADLQSAGDMP